MQITLTITENETFDLRQKKFTCRCHIPGHNIFDIEDNDNSCIVDLAKRSCLKVLVSSFDDSPNSITFVTIVRRNQKQIVEPSKEFDTENEDRDAMIRRLQRG